MDKLHMLNISFMVDSMNERRGGCAGNIAYTLALLGEHPVVVSAAGKDFGGYLAHMKKVGVATEGIRIVNDQFTALCYITTDLKGSSCPCSPIRRSSGAYRVPWPMSATTTSWA